MSEDPAAKSAPAPAPEEPGSIEKPPPGEILARFKTKRPLDERIQTLLPALPHGKISEAKDYVRLHPDDAYWSGEYCFVMVPVPGIKGSVLHLLASDLAEARPPGSLQFFRLALATKPHDQFFLAQVPSRNLDNEWNRSNLEACTAAKASWKMVISKATEGSEGYHIKPTESELRGEGDPFPEPNWPAESLDAIVAKAFDGRMILNRESPAWRRLVGLKQKLS
jgi:hypothetical protein